MYLPKILTIFYFVQFDLCILLKSNNFYKLRVLFIYFYTIYCDYIPNKKAIQTITIKHIRFLEKIYTIFFALFLYATCRLLAIMYGLFCPYTGRDVINTCDICFHSQYFYVFKEFLWHTLVQLKSYSSIKNI